MEGRVWSFVLPYVRPPLSANRRETHWSPAHKEYREVRDSVIYLAKHWQQRHGLALTPGTRVDVTLLWYLGSDRRADSDNPSDSLKPILDGLTRAKVWRDDNAHHVRRAASEVVPRMYDPERRTRPTVILEIREVVDEHASGSGRGAQHADGTGRPGSPERAGEYCPDCPRQSVSDQRNRRSPHPRDRRHGNQRDLVR